jgi:hypothetical protein
VNADDGNAIKSMQIERRRMIRWLGVFFSLAVTFSASAEGIALTGKVSDNKGNPIAGAIVSLSNQPHQDTTDENGQYSLTGAGIVHHGVMHLGAGQISLRNGNVSLSLAKSDQVCIDLFDIRGRTMARLINRPLAAGEYRFSLTGAVASQLTLVRVTAGQRTMTFPYLPGPENNRSDSYSLTQAENGMQRLVIVPAGSLDSLLVWKPGYVLGVKPLTSYTGEENFTLDTINLPVFSFFVTSLKAILELSKNDSGFGGDFRFGMTGPGAGLRGADSICSCIAEKRMPGSSAKLWRAFLSVTKDAKGRQVNAIDRIGNGPWFDYKGRLLAPTVADLKNDRPTNGDPLIAKDLPNEDGIPNHKPDGITIVDNHHFVTGSKPDGTLLIGAGGENDNSTCDDWTSTTALGKPRCGFSWPRGDGGGMMGGTNWISGFNAGGCARGIELVVNNLNSKIIGNAGGYGGFYCFALTP